MNIRFQSITYFSVQPMSGNLRRGANPGKLDRSLGIFNCYLERGLLLDLCLFLAINRAAGRGVGGSAEGR